MMMKIKFTFFLVDFQTGFYSQAAWQGTNALDVNNV
jgi:hypothetical protein